jgi:predicted RNase H-like HicB family nuclease
MKLTIWIQPDQGGGYTAECPELPGAVARGKSWDETLREMDDQLRETFAAHLEQAIAAARRDLREPLAPQAVSLEFAFVSGVEEDGDQSYATVA